MKYYLISEEQREAILNLLRSGDVSEARLQLAAFKPVKNLTKQTQTQEDYFDFNI